MPVINWSIYTTLAPQDCSIVWLTKNNKSKTVLGLLTTFWWYLNNFKTFELVFSQIGGLEPELQILEDLDIFWQVCSFSFVWSKKREGLILRHCGKLNSTHPSRLRQPQYTCKSCMSRTTLVLYSTLCMRKKPSCTAAPRLGGALRQLPHYTKFISCIAAHALRRRRRGAAILALLYSPAKKGSFLFIWEFLLVFCSFFVFYFLY